MSKGFLFVGTRLADECRWFDRLANMARNATDLGRWQRDLNWQPGLSDRARPMVRRITKCQSLLTIPSLIYPY